MPNSKELDNIQQQAKGCHQALIELERLAGIADSAETIRSELPNYFAVYDAAELHSDKQRELELYEEKSQQRRIRRRLRDLYFSISDLEFRKRLISHDREAGDIALRFFQQELADAARNLDIARSAHNHWWVWAAFWGSLIIGSAYYFFGLIGALGGLLLGFFNGRHMEQGASRARETAVIDAERELQEAQAMWDGVRNEPQNFSQREARTGEPDTESQLPAA